MNTDYVMQQRGLGLLDLSIALLVISMVLIAVPEVWIQKTQAQGRMDQKRIMAEVKDSLSMYLQVNGYLPCPDTDGDGYENRKISYGKPVCRAREGELPYADLATHATDAWRNAWYYRVHQRAESATYINRLCEPASVFAKEGSDDLTGLMYCPETVQFYCSSDCDLVCSSACQTNISPYALVNQHQPPYFHLATRPVGTLPVQYDLQILDANEETLSQGVVAVVVSFGENGQQQSLENCDPRQLDLHEVENCDGDRVFVSDAPIENKDHVIWFDMNQAKFSLMHSKKFRP